MSGLIYGLCALAALSCACLLLHAYQQSRYNLLLWGGLCFVGLTINNSLVVIDKFLVPLMDLYTLRLFTAFMALLIFLYGLIFDTE